MNNYIQDKNKLVNSVFTKVHKKYDVMNDIMSLGIHRLWKKKLIDWMNPQLDTKLIDVASGTGDIAKLILKKTYGSSKVTCVEPNIDMLRQGKLKLSNLDRFSNFIERSNKMKMVVTHEVEDIEKWLENRNERHGTISKFAKNCKKRQESVFYLDAI